ncbi:MAG: tRNA (adenosine(37)-N6)-threonylcarbamoyltransferase complex ATPase subunit type 1 TsaE, partial [Chloroflexota bacterium]
VNIKDQSIKINSDTVKKTEKIGALLGALLKEDSVICLLGGLGAGKTTLTRGIGLGWRAQDRITSPTFTLVNEYSRHEDDQKMYHLDCYRLQGSDDVETIGLEDLLDFPGPIVIEWPMVAMDWLPSDLLKIHITPFSTAADEGRSLDFVSSGPFSNELLKKFAKQIAKWEREII